MLFCIKCLLPPEAVASEAMPPEKPRAAQRKSMHGACPMCHTQCVSSLAYSTAVHARHGLVAVQSCMFEIQPLEDVHCDDENSFTHAVEQSHWATLIIDDINSPVRPHLAAASLTRTTRDVRCVAPGLGPAAQRGRLRCGMDSRTASIF